MLLATILLFSSMSVIRAADTTYHINETPRTIESRQTRYNSLNPWTILRTFVEPNTNLNMENQMLLETLIIQLEQLEQANSPINIARRNLARAVAALEVYSAALNLVNSNLTSADEAIFRLRSNDPVRFADQILSIVTSRSLVQETLDTIGYADILALFRSTTTRIEIELSTLTEEQVPDVEIRIAAILANILSFTIELEDLGTFMDGALIVNDPSRQPLLRRLCDVYGSPSRDISDSLATDVETLRGILERKTYIVDSFLPNQSISDGTLETRADSIDALLRRDDDQLPKKDVSLMKQKETLLKKLELEIGELRHEKEITPLRILLERTSFLEAFIDDVSDGPENPIAENPDREAKETLSQKLLEIENEISIDIETYGILSKQERTDLAMLPISMVKEKYKRIVKDLQQEVISQTRFN